MSDVDHGIAGAIGAAVASAAYAIKRLVSGDPKLPSETPAPIAARVGRLYEDHANLKQEVANMRHDFAAKIDQLAEDIGELQANHASTAAILSQVGLRLTELRDDLRQRREKD